VKLYLTGDGGVLLDEIEIIKGAFPLEQAKTYPGVERLWPEDVFLLPRLHVAHAWPSPVYLNTRSSVAKTGLDIAVDVPTGLSLHGHEPSARIEREGHAYHRYVFGKIPGFVFFETTHPAGWEGTLHLSVGNTMTCRRPIKVINLPRAQHVTQLCPNVDWMGGIDTYMAWPRFLDFWEHVGMKTIAFYHKQLTMDDDSRQDRVAFIAEARKRGFELVAIDSPMFYEYVKQSDDHPEVQRIVNRRAMEGKRMCPRLYVRDYLDTDVGACRTAGAAGISRMWLDFEPNWGVRGRICFCPHCKDAFKTFLAGNYSDLEYADPSEFEGEPLTRLGLHDAWLAFNSRLGREILRRLRAGLKEGLRTCKGHENDPISIGVYNVSPWMLADRKKIYHHFMHFEDLFREGLVEEAMPSLYHKYRDDIGKAVRCCRQAVGTGGRIVPWVGIMSGRAELRYRLLELFANGGAGFSYYTGKHVDVFDYAVISRITTALAPVEDIIMNGTPIAGDAVRLAIGEAGEIKVWGDGAVNGMRLNGRLLLLVTSYENGTPVHLLIPKVPRPRTVMNLETRELFKTLAPGKNDFAVDLTGQNRAALLLVCP